MPYDACIMRLKFKRELFSDGFDPSQNASNWYGMTYEWLALLQSMLHHRDRTISPWMWDLVKGIGVDDVCWWICFPYLS